MTSLDASSIIEIPESPDTLGGAFRFFIQNTSPLIIMGWCAGALGMRLYLGNYTLWDLVVVAGILAWWPFQEWLIHVFILHFKPKKIGKWTFDPRVSWKHRRHHRDPWRVDILFIPVHTYFLTIPALMGLWLGLAPTAALAYTGLAFTGLMTLHYEWVHYLVHTRYKPKSAYYQMLWRNHRLHHCKNEHFWQGVTMTFADKVLGTAKDKNDVETSETCRTLGCVEDLGAD